MVKRSLRSSPLWAIGLIAMLGVGLNACGGGGSSMTDMTEMPISQDEQNMAVSDAIDAAMGAVGGLSAMSTDEEVSAVKALIMAAKDELAGATALSATQALALNGRISTIEGTLAGTEMAIAGHRQMVAEAAEAQRVVDVEMARANAMASYMTADSDANMADTVAIAAEMTATGSVGAMDARAAATAARTAADAAKAAHDAIMDGMTKAEADAQAEEAATQAGHANSSYITAKMENDAIQTGALIGEQQQEVRDIADAQEAAKMAAEEAMDHYQSALGKATDARTQANMARAAANMAKYARANYADANKYAMMAEAAATKAVTARNAAKAASDAAQAAYMAAMGATTSEAAEMQQAEAEKQNGIATDNHTGTDGAGMNYMAAKDAAGKATEAAGEHVLGLLLAANAADVMDDATTPDTDEQAVAVMAVATAVGVAVAEADQGSDGTTATATWPGTLDDPETDDADESAMNVLSIAVTPEGGTALMFRTEAVVDDPDTENTDESAPKTATKLYPGLGDFMHGYSISDGNTHAIVFTDQVQGTPAVTEVMAIAEEYLVRDAVAGSAVTDLGTRSGTGYRGVTYYNGITTVDDDTDMDLAFTGTLTCPDTAACTASTAEDGTITVTNYVFTGSREGRAAVAEAAAVTEMPNYLAFGVWLQEAENANVPDVGVFADGGSTAEVDVVVTGSARYMGDAAGLYTQGSSVDYFQGDATLTAEFGEEPEMGDDTALGTITGKINNIMAGGMATGDVIHLNDDDDAGDNIEAAGTFSGDARMGTATTVDAVTTYTHNGSWSGQFYNGTADDADTTDVDESEVAPGSVAGTFGVTGTVGEGDAAVTTSYVGAFGAHQ